MKEKEKIEMLMKMFFMNHQIERRFDVEVVKAKEDKG
jgi:hypothetical protein